METLLIAIMCPLLVVFHHLKQLDRAKVRAGARRAAVRTGRVVAATRDRSFLLRDDLEPRIRAGLALFANSAGDAIADILMNSAIVIDDLAPRVRVGAQRLAQETRRLVTVARERSLLFRDELEPRIRAGLIMLADAIADTADVLEERSAVFLGELKVGLRSRLRKMKAQTGQAAAEMGRNIPRSVKKAAPKVAWSVQTLGLGVLLASGLMLFHSMMNSMNTWAAAEDLIDPQNSSVQVVDRNGAPLFEFSGPNGGMRTPIPLDKISPHLANATIAAEDADFWENSGINVKGISRALYENLAFWETGGLLRGSGGSSITQQLAKQLYVPADEWFERSFVRKAKETLLALVLTRRYSKEQILESYLNRVFYANSTYGAEAASRRYFEKPASQLNLAEAALLAGVPNAPAEYDPINNYQAAKARQEQVLDLMARHGHITAEQAQRAKAEPLNIHRSNVPIKAPHFVMYVRDLLPRLLGDHATKGGYRVITSLDVNVQTAGEQILAGQLANFGPRFGADNAALVAIQPATGEVLAMVGSKDYSDDALAGQVNNALTLNQSGSVIKPITYLAAFTKGWSPATIVPDVPMALSDGRQSFVLTNADNRYRGNVTARAALGSSLNVPAVRALEVAGLSNVISLGRQMGLSTLKDPSAYGPSFTLGGADVSLLDMTYAFSVLANGGEQRGTPALDRPTLDARPLDPVAVLRVVDVTGNVLYQFKPYSTRVVSAPETYLVTSILSDNGARTEMFGANSPLNLAGRPAAVKSGLTDGPRDAWAIGYTPQLVAGVWVGNADNRPMPGAVSSQTAAPIWHDFMATALGGLPPAGFNPPPGVVMVDVCQATGLLPSRGCPRVVKEVFVAGAEPKVAAPDQPPPQLVPVRSQNTPAPARTPTPSPKKKKD